MLWLINVSVTSWSFTEWGCEPMPKPQPGGPDGPDSTWWEQSTCVLPLVCCQGHGDTQALPPQQGGKFALGPKWLTPPELIPVA